ncbi:Uncharacterized protein FKW44_006601 [Caligus rogercresseyi]|uniref:Uncharacterized protein n=1 Tax=Caligus rogercresseyi TaxID=217165 RepID=A0A7T8QSZ9_CALRO|nr:Uncharacterized protein FKW44_006601 [Caligus rogercresseyi]
MSESAVNPSVYSSLAAYDDYGDTSELLDGRKKTTMSRLGYGDHGHGDGYGHSDLKRDKILCDPEGINETLLLLLIGGLIGGGILLLLKINNMERRSFQNNGILDDLWSGQLAEKLLISMNEQS